MRICIKNASFWVSLFILALLAGCGGPKTTLYETPSLSATEKEDWDLFSKALKAQKLKKYRHASKLLQEFLDKYPDSFQAYNNLGMIYFIEDQLNHSIEAFDAAYKHSPKDKNQKIVENLIVALKFKITLLKENREYVRGLKLLIRLHGLVPDKKKEKIRSMIEDFDDRIFEKVMRENNIEAYERYLENYPKGYNVIEAKERLIEMKERPGGGPMSFNSDQPEETAKPEGVLDLPANESWVVEEAPEVQKAPLNKPSPKAVTQAAADLREPEGDDLRSETKEKNKVDPELEEEAPPLASAKSEPKNQNLETLNPDPPVEAKKVARKPQQIENSAKVPLNLKVGAIIPRGSGIGHLSSSEDEMVSLYPLEDKGPGNVVTLETDVEETQSQLAKVQFVKVVVKDDQYLNVLDQPSIESKVVGQLEKNDVCILLNEIEGWFQVKYAGENTGWISQQFSEKIN